MIRPLAILLALGGTAFAQDWSSYQDAFPALPCHDGWAACVVDGQPMNADMTATSPADLRVDWDTLRPTAAFSPFSGLSAYSGGAPDVAAADVDEGGEPPADDDGVAAVEPSEAEVEAEREADEAAAVEAAAKASEDEARRQEQEAAEARKAAAKAAEAAAREEAARRAEAEKLAAQASKAEAAERARLEKEAAAARQAAEAAEAKRKAADEAEAKRRAQEDAARKQAEEEERKRKDAEAAAAAKAAEAARIKADEDAKRREQEEAARRAEEEKKKREAEEAARKAEETRKAAEAAAAAEKAATDAEQAKRLAAEREAADKAAAEAKAKEAQANDAAAAAAEPVAGSAPGDDSCDNLQALEPAAMLGKLSGGQATCLEGALAASAKMTDKKKISVILMQNAFSKGDKNAWEELVKRHLDEIDQSDPDLCFQYAVYLAGKGPSRASGVIRWSNVALENRTVWTGDTYKSRVYSLYKFRAAASQMLWQSAEQEHAASPSEATSSKVEKYRNMTKVNAREWYEYAKVSGKDATKALQLCVSAAGTADYCDAG